MVNGAHSCFSGQLGYCPLHKTRTCENPFTTQCALKNSVVPSVNVLSWKTHLALIAFQPGTSSMRLNVSFQMINWYSLCTVHSQSMLCGRLMASLKDSGVMMASKPSTEVMKACLHAGGIGDQLLCQSCDALVPVESCLLLLAGVQSALPVML